MDYDQPIQISDHTYWIGTYDDRDAFQCNPYLIKINGTGILIDPGSVLYLQSFFEKLKALVEFESITHIILQHQDPDVCGNIAQVLDAVRAAGNSDCKIITHRRTAALVRHYRDDLPFEYTDDYPQKTLLLDGQKTLAFVHTPYLHAPGAFATYFNTDKILFSGDIFGGTTQHWDLYAGDDYFDEIKAFHEAYMPSKEILQFSMNLFERYDIETTAPQHGSVMDRRQTQLAISQFKNFECGLFIDQSFRDELQAARKKIEEQNRIMNKELDVAGRFQQTLLPDPETIKADIGCDIAFLYEPYSHVSGDFLIIDPIDPDHIGIMVVDVVDHGVTAGLATIQLKTLFDEYKRESFSPVSLLQLINDKAFSIAENDVFFTALYMIYDRKNSDMAIGSAGGIPIIYYNARTNESKLISMRSTAIGLCTGDDCQFEETRFPFGINDCLIMQTDGLMDCTNSRNEPFDRVKSQKKFIQAIAKEKPSREILDDIVKGAKSHNDTSNTFGDDATVVVFKRMG